MDPECGLVYDDCLTVDHWRQNVLRCCESARTSSRSPIEQLADVSDMMQIDLSEAINYKNGTWNVRYAIGPLTAKDKGSDRSKCMLRCQKQMLHRIRAFCGENGGEDCARTPQDNGREQVSFVDETKSTDVEVSAKVPSLQETPSSCEGDRTGGKPETTAELSADGPETTVESSPDESETASTEIGAGESGDADALQQDTDRPIDSVVAGAATDALTRDAVQSIADAPETDESKASAVADSIIQETRHECKTPSCDDCRTAESSGAQATVGEDDHNAVTTCRDDKKEERSAESAKVGPSGESKIATREPAETALDEQTTSTAEGASAEEPKKTIVELLSADVPQTIVESSTKASAEISPDESGGVDVLQQLDTNRPIDSVLVGAAIGALTKDNVQSLADELLHSLGTDESNVGVVVDSIVREACCEPDRDCELYAEMCCVLYEKALADARPTVRDGVSSLFKNRLIDTLSTSISGKGKPEDERKPDEEEHRRRLAASRFLGVLYLKKRLNVYFAVSRTVYILLESCGPSNAESLECLCMLLMTVGPKLKKVSRWSTSISMKKIYDELERCVKVECSENAVLPERTVSMINRLLDLKKRKWVN